LIYSRKTTITIFFIFVFLSLIIVVIISSAHFIKCLFSNDKVYTTAIVEKKYRKMEGVFYVNWHMVRGVEIKYVIDGDTITGVCELKEREYKNINEQDTIPICIYNGIMSKIFYKKCSCFEASPFYDILIH